MTVVVSISMSADLRSALDAEAERQRRSRSFVVAEAVREYLVRQERDAFEDARLRDLRDALELMPAARLQLSEDLWRELSRGRDATEPWTATFSTFAEYRRWLRRREEQGS